MHLVGHNFWSEPENRQETIEVLKEVISLGINHIVMYNPTKQTV